VKDDQKLRELFELALLSNPSFKAPTTAFGARDSTTAAMPRMKSVRRSKYGNMFVFGFGIIWRSPF
jgi:hypothetical protein